MRPLAYLRIGVPALAFTLACSDSLTAPGPDVAGRTDPPTPSTPAIPPSSLGTATSPIHLTGGGFVTDLTVTASYGTTRSWGTTILAASGPLVEEKSKCCRILGDTILQINYGGQPALGARAMEPPKLVLGGGDFRHYGADDALVMIRDGDLRMRFYVPVSAWTLEITGLIAPIPGQDGEIRGRVAFEAVVLVQEREDILAPMFLRRLDGTTMVYADFVTPMRYRFSTIELPF